jgi:hypothetical protein
VVVEQVLMEMAVMALMALLALVVLETGFGGLLEAGAEAVGMVQTARLTMLALAVMAVVLFLMVQLALLVLYTLLITDHRRNYGNKKLRHKQLEIL